MANSNLAEAKRAKNDEFYTQLTDIEREMFAYIDYNPDVFRGKTILLPCDDPEWSNFTKFFVLKFKTLGLKKLISTSYAHASNVNKVGTEWKPTEFETSRKDSYDPKKSATHGKIFTLDRDINGDGRINFDDLEYEYLEGDGDFRSPEVTALRDEADIIITNPPFSLFREFLAWIMEADKQFIMIGNMNAITYKEVFPLIKENKMWLGIHHPKEFIVKRINEERDNIEKNGEGELVAKFGNICWYTNIEHGRRHKPLILLTMERNLRFNRTLIKKGGYQKYDNYDAIEVPVVNGIPKDYDGVMGVPISFLDKYCPEQFEIVNANDFRISEDVPYKAHGLVKDKEATITTKNVGGGTIREQLTYESSSDILLAPGADGWHVNGKRKYARIFIRHKRDFLERKE